MNDVLLVLPVLAVLGAGTCDPGPCQATADCPPGLVCRDASCVAIIGPGGNGGPPRTLLSQAPPVEGQGEGEGEGEVDHDVTVVITADNSYSFGYGTIDQVATLRGRAPTRSAADIFSCPIGLGPERYVVPEAEAPVGSYLYVVAWADRSTTQGLIASFARNNGEVILTGDPAFEVCAMGLEFNGVTSPGPDLFQVNDAIASCNAGYGDPNKASAGWVDSGGAVPSTPAAQGLLVVGEDNSSDAGGFQVACAGDASGPGVPATARWVWYSPLTSTSLNDNDPFSFATIAQQTNDFANPTRQFLIFRLAARTLFED